MGKSSSTQFQSNNTQPLIYVEHVSYRIKTRAQNIAILRDITFSIPGGSLFAINGPSGSGKSTLLSMLTGIDRPDQGRIIFGGEEIRAKGENQLARWRGKHVGIVFQFFQLIPTLSAQENVLLAMELGGCQLPRQTWRQHALQCLQVVGMGEYINRLPSELSGGQQQRVDIARALANDPPVIIADEPTGNLDTHTAHAIFEIFIALIQRGKTIVYVTHDPNLARQASSGITLVDGQIMPSASPVSQNPYTHEGTM